MIIEIILFIVLLIALVIATITDFKRREVPNWVSYSLITTALTLRLMYSITTKEWNFLFIGLLGFAIFFIIGNLMYYAKQWGGGDSKLLMGVGASLATYPSFLLNYLNPKLEFHILAIFLINLFIGGGIYGTIWSLILITKNKDKFKKEFKELRKQKFNKIISLISVILIVLLIISLMITKERLITIVLIIFILVLPILFIAVKAIEKSCMYKTILTKNLTEGDWIASKEIRKKYKISDIGIEKTKIAQLKRDQIKKVLVKQGIPFTVSFLIAFILTIIFGNLIFYFI